MIVHNINPTLFSLGPLEVRYYGLVYVIGFLLALFWLPRLAKRYNLKNVNQKFIDDFIFWAIIGALVGGRLFHIIFYDLSYYLQNPLQMIMIWKGGISFHGSFLGVIIASIILCKLKKVHFFDLADISVLPFSLMLFFGRIANFINSELVGKASSLPWCVIFPNVMGCRHPSQIYEAVKNLIIFGILLFLIRKKWKQGLIFWSFVTSYGFLRFIVEFWKDMPIYAGLTMGQWLSLPMIILGVVFLIITLRKR